MTLPIRQTVHRIGVAPIRLLGKSLLELAGPGRWSQGPPLLKQSAEYWPKKPEQTPTVGSSELKGITFCCFTAVEPNNNIPDATQYSSWKELVEATRRAYGAAATDPTHNQLISHRDAEVLLLRGCQAHSFSGEVAALKAQKPVSKHSHLLSLAPEWDAATGLIRVGGRLRRLNPSVGEIHPIVLDPRHSAVKLLIKDMDERLLHPGTERGYAELRRQYWILRGRQAIRHHQLNCSTCQRWRAQPKVPQMADLPPQRLRFFVHPSTQLASIVLGLTW
ncbi:hypothetical protein N1851_023267 [Merluccius polli]|uniref:Integrase zinc-binding domain-containing protein n=1 Tax=Merluccius polli TaxID=89951 RepID=A0AA47MGN5_MERPO|nr:hypothetical protein N1851_023267 [Merluccius polli]